MTTILDLDRYFRRIGYTGDTAPTLPVLAALHQHHAGAIPFENLDVLMDRPISLDLADLQAKLVEARRGGYCFEQNLLFAAVLEELGFELNRLVARVLYRGSSLRPRTHMLLRVRLDSAEWLADVGFGGEGLLRPLALLAGRETPQQAWTYRLRTAAHDEWVLQSRWIDGWQDLYSFSLAPQLPVDYEPANFYVSMHPQSRFRQTLTAQRVTPEARYVLRDRELTVDRGPGREERRTLRGEREILAALREIFGIALPEGLRVPLFVA